MLYEVITTCAYVCPARIKLVQRFRIGKAQVRAETQKQAAKAAAKEAAKAAQGAK